MVDAMAHLQSLRDIPDTSGKLSDLCVDANCQYEYKSCSCAHLTTDITIYVADGGDCHKLSWNDRQCCEVEECYHEEADTKLIVHEGHASSCHSSGIIKSYGWPLPPKIQRI